VNVQQPAEQGDESRRRNNGFRSLPGKNLPLIQAYPEICSNRPKAAISEMMNCNMIVDRYSGLWKFGRRLKWPDESA
jgi:hypothetical protein